MAKVGRKPLGARFLGPYETHRGRWDVEFRNLGERQRFQFESKEEADEFIRSKRGWLKPPKPPRKGDKGPEGYVYFIRPDGTEWIKVGSARDVRKRLAELQTAWPVPLILLASLHVHNRTEVEAIIRKSLVAHRIAREWYHAKPEVMSLVVEVNKNAGQSRIPSSVAKMLLAHGCLDASDPMDDCSNEISDGEPDPNGALDDGSSSESA